MKVNVDSRGQRPMNFDFWPVVKSWYGPNTPSRSIGVMETADVGEKVGHYKRIPMKVWTSLLSLDDQLWNCFLWKVNHTTNSIFTLDYHI